MNKCLVLVIFLSGISQIVRGRVLSYDKAIDIALKKSYTIKSFRQSKLAMQYNIQYHRAEFKPRLDATVSAPAWNEMVTPIPQVNGLPVYNSVGSVMFAGDLAFTYMLPTGGNFALSSSIYRDDLSTTPAMKNYQTLKTSKAYSSLTLSFNQPILTANTLKEGLQEARYYYERESSRFTRGQMDIVYQVTEGFYHLYQATRTVEIAGEKQANAREALRIAKIKAKTGRIPEVDVLRTRVDLAKSDAELSEAVNRLEREKDHFKLLIGLDLDEVIEIETALQYDTFKVDMQKAVRSALKNRLELAESELNIKLARIDLKRARRSSELKGNISAYYDFTGVSTLHGGATRELFHSSFDNFIERRPNRGVTLTLSCPVFDWGRGSALEQKATAELRDNVLYLENKKRVIIRQVRDVVRSVNEAGNRLKIYRQNHKVAELTYKISKKRFENGDINSQELALEQERLAASQLAYLDAFITYQLHVADLKRKTLWDFETDKNYLDGEQL